MSFFRWSLCLRVRSMSPGPAPASPWPPQPRPGPPWTKLVLYLYICTVQYLMGNSATADLRGVVSSWPLKQPAPALWQNRLLCVTVHMYTALRIWPCCPGETAWSLPASRRCSPRRSSYPGQRRSLGLHSPGCPETDKLIKHFVSGCRVSDMGS